MRSRVDSEVDQRTLESFVDALFTPRAYESGFMLVPAMTGGGLGKALLAPEGTRLQDYIEWSTKLPEREPPSWLSLPPNSEQLLAIAEADTFIGSLRKMRSLTDDEETVMADAAVPAAVAVGASGAVSGSFNIAQPAWMRALQQTCEALLKTLQSAPEMSKPGTASAAGQDDPLARFFARENEIGSRLLRQISADLRDLVAVCQGEAKQTNKIRELIDVVNKGEFLIVAASLVANLRTC